jgi:hypothetical protein
MPNHRIVSASPSYRVHLSLTALAKTCLGGGSGGAGAAMTTAARNWPWSTDRKIILNRLRTRHMGFELRLVRVGS